MSEFLKGPKWFIDAVCRHYSKFYNKCLFVTTPSQHLLDYMVHYGLTQKAKAVSNPMDTISFLPAKDETGKKNLKNKFGFSLNTVLCAGRLADEKHVDDVIRAITLVQKEIPDVCLAIAGHGVAESKLKKLVSELKITDRVKFLGFVSKEDLPLVYKASDLYAIMSTAESQSISLILAMATGLPVIVANSRALPEYANITNGAVVEVGDYQTLAKEIVKILSNKDLAKKLGQGGVFTAAKYSALNVAMEWEEIYKKAIAGTI
jgi:glycosyltransferase involved in cell wall biosynthesis